MAKKETHTEEEPETGEVARRRRFDRKRKESGLRMVKLYLDNHTVEALNTLSRKYGYSEAKLQPTIDTRSEVRSNIVSYLIRNAASANTPANLDKSETCAIAQQIYRLREIIKYRRESQGNSDREVISFLNEIKQPTVDQILAAPQSLGVTWKLDEYPHRNWKKEDLEYALDDKKIRKLLRLVSTSKKKLLKPKS